MNKKETTQKDNFDILKNTTFIGGNPEENNVYGFVSWSESGEGIVALRNPDSEKAPLTVTFNKLMGVPEAMSERKAVAVCSRNPAEPDSVFSYNDKLSFELEPLEAVIIKFVK